MRTLVAVLLIAPLAISGCKKKDTEEAGPKLTVQAESGSWIEDPNGRALVVGVMVRNNQAEKAEIKAVSATITGASGATCNASQEASHTLNPNDEQKINIRFSNCGISAQSASIQGEITWAGGTRNFKGDVAIQ